jgi:hypothetical protein
MAENGRLLKRVGFTDVIAEASGKQRLALDKAKVKRKK